MLKADSVGCMKLLFFPRDARLFSSLDFYRGGIIEWFAVSLPEKSETPLLFEQVMGA